MDSLPLKFIQAPSDFPDIHSALQEPDGLLAFSDCLTTELVLAAYNRGIFPWFSADQPILWWSPSTRAILIPDEIRIRKSLRQSIRQKGYSVTINTAFVEVIKSCANITRKDQQDTWITEEMIAVYSELHKQGKAHSIEAWHQGKLVGGLYGIYANGMFCGESMFSVKTDASKICLVALSQHAHALAISIIDCQIMNPHLLSLGATEITRKQFTHLFKKNCTELSKLDSDNLEILL